MFIVFILVVSFSFAHLVCDYTSLCTLNMVKAKQFVKPIIPIFYHSLINGIGYGIVTFIFTFPSIWLSIIILIIETISHTIFDTLKGRINIFYPIAMDKTKQPYYTIMGIDQFFHYCIIGLCIYLILIF